LSEKQFSISIVLSSSSLTHPHGNIWWNKGCCFTKFG